MRPSWLFLGLIGSIILAQSNFYGPRAPPHFDSPVLAQIQVQIKVYDDPDLEGMKIQSVSFDQQAIHLQTANLEGFRAEAGFQVFPGTYELVWVVSPPDPFAWPRRIRHKEQVQIHKGDDWVQIIVRGEEVTVS